MHVRIGKYISKQKVKYADIDINTCNGVYKEVEALEPELDLILDAANKTCTLEEFHKDGEAYMLTNSSHHKKNFIMSYPFWLVVEQSGCLWNLNALNCIKGSSLQ